MRRWGRCLPPLIPMSLTLELRSWPARQHRALLLPYAKGCSSLNTDYNKNPYKWDFVPSLLSSAISD